MRKTLIHAVLLILGAIIAWYCIAGRPLLAELALSIHGQTVRGSLTDAQESYEGKSDAGQDMWNTSLRYEYRLPDGRVFGSFCTLNRRIEPWFRNLVPVTVEYLPEKPQVSRLKGTARENIGEMACLSIVLIGLPVWYGIAMLKDDPRRRRS